MAMPKEELIAARFQTTLALFEMGETMLRQKLRRKHPEASAAEIEAHVREWLPPPAPRGAREARGGPALSTETRSAAPWRGLAVREPSRKRPPQDRQRPQGVGWVVGPGRRFGRWGAG